jgi:hypothetical protein
MIAFTLIVISYGTFELGSSLNIFDDRMCCVLQVSSFWILSIITWNFNYFQQQVLRDGSSFVFRYKGGGGDLPLDLVD